MQDNISHGHLVVDLIIFIVFVMPEIETGYQNQGIVGAVDLYMYYLRYIKIMLNISTVDMPMNITQHE